MRGSILKKVTVEGCQGGFLNQEHQHHPGMTRNAYCDPTPNPLNLTLWGGAQSRKPERKPVLGRSKLILKGLVV